MQNKKQIFTPYLPSYEYKPDGEFVYGGRIHSTSDVGINGHSVENPVYPNGNTHGSIVELNGKYYIFDHRLTNNSSYCRQGVAEQIFFDENGHIAQVGEDRECEPGQYIRGIRDNCLIGYKYFCFENCKSVTLTVCGRAEG